MSKTLIRNTSLTLLPLAFAISSIPAQATDIVVTDISFMGLERLTPESLYPLLPISIGSRVTDANLADSVKSLYASNQFSDIQANINGNKLEFYVVERPVIAEVKFEGNKLIPTEGLKKGLKQAGLAEGELLKQSTLVNVANELQQQYIQQGYYNSDINVDQQLIDGNRAKVDMTFKEGKPAEVVDINVIGNKSFSDSEIKDVFALKEKSWRNLLSKSDHYAQEKLQASLENLKALYLNSGYVRFNIDNAIINISEDKQKVYIEVAISEGGKYQFGDVSFLGQHPFARKELQKLVSFHAAETYNQQELDNTTDALKNHFGNEGFYFAQIRPVPQINDVTKTVDIDYYLDPARPIYVRRISFDGNTSTKDQVLRRQMRQLEGALASNEKIQLSKIRLMRTGFFKSVNVDVRAVPNQPDQVDIVYSVEEQPTGNSSIAAGYSQSGGVTFQVELNQKNFMGTGNRVNAAMSRSETRDSYSLAYTDPYFTENGVSQSISAYYNRTKYDDKNISNYVSDSLGGSLRYGYPVNENIRVNAGLNVDKTDITGGRWMGINITLIKTT